MENKLYLLYETIFDYSNAISHKEVIYISNDYCFLVDKKDEYRAADFDKSAPEILYEIQEMSDLHIHIVK